MSYQDLYLQSIEQPEVFWRKQAELIKWYEFPETWGSTLCPDKTTRAGYLQTSMTSHQFFADNPAEITSYFPFNSDHKGPN